jgi:hypothetical protein
MHLPPIIYSTPPKPKKLERRRSLRQTASQSAAGIKYTNESAVIDETIGLGQQAPANSLISENLTPIDGSERKPTLSSGRLSQGTLKELLLVQEKNN